MDRVLSVVGRIKSWSVGTAGEMGYPRSGWSYHVVCLALVPVSLINMRVKHVTYGLGG